MNGMSDNVYAHETAVATDLFAAGDGNLFQRVMQMRMTERGQGAEGDAASRHSARSP
jgi:hypothetical protein